jgi:hypothetical protein
MPVRKRTVKRRGLLDADEEAWLRGDQKCGFVEFQHWDELEALWLAYGDDDAFHWERGMYRPVPLNR